MRRVHTPYIGVPGSPYNSPSRLGNHDPVAAGLLEAAVAAANAALL
jgi:hypothetical protein